MERNTAIEKHVSEHIAIMLYIALESSNVPVPEGAQTLENLRKKRTVRQPKKARFVISNDAKQHLSKIYVTYVAEMNGIELADDDTIDSISEKLEDEYTDCISLFILKNCCGKWPEPLRNHHDESNWFNEKTNSMMTQYSARRTIIARTCDIFDGFLKTIATLIAKFIVYGPIPISSKNFLGFMSILELDDIFIEELSGSILPPIRAAAKKTRSVGKAGGNESVENSESDSSADAGKLDGAGNNSGALLDESSIESCLNDDDLL